MPRLNAIIPEHDRREEPHGRPAQRKPVALAIAQAMVEGFNKHYRIFRETSRRAKESFEAADWQGQLQSAVRDRVQFYDDRVNRTVQRLHEEFDAASIDDATWQAAKLQFIGLLINHKQPGTGRDLLQLGHHQDPAPGLLQQHLPLRPAGDLHRLHRILPAHLLQLLPPDEGLRASIRRIIEDFDWQRASRTSTGTWTT